MAEFKNFRTIIVFAALTQFGTAQCTKLHIGILLELSEYWSAKYGNFFAYIFKQAFESITQRSDILPGYEFELEFADTKGNNGLAATKMVKMLTEGNPKVAIIGPTKSESVAMAGQIAPVFHTVHMSCIAISAAIQDKAKFPTLFKVNQADNLLNPLRIKMMKHFGWSRVATLAYQDEYNVPQINGFLDLVHANNLTLVSSAIMANKQLLQGIFFTFKQFNVRIIMGSFHADTALPVFCEAYKQGMYGPSYVWILSGTTLHPGWIEATEDCTLEQMQTALYGHFALHNLDVGYSNETTILGKSAAEEMASLRVLDSSTPYVESRNSPYVVDTAWALALGLNNSLKYLDEKGLSLSRYKYSEDFNQAIVNGIKETSFVGVSGPLSFDDSHGRIGTTYIKQTTGDVETIVAYYDLNKDKLTWVVDENSLWTDGRAPRDNFEYRTYLVPPKVSAATIIILLNTLGCVSTLGFLVFNIYYRNNWSIKMSSPYVNNVIIIGCLVMYTEVYLGTMEYMHVGNRSRSEDFMCMSRTISITIGFTLLFGSMFAKTYRVHYLFREHKIRKKFIKDRHLLAMVLVLILIDLAILIPWSTLFPFRQQEIVKLTKDSADKNLIYSEIFPYCYNEKQMYWLVTLYIYKGLLLAFGTFLAWETRHVTIPELNDSKYIGACIYNVVVVCIFGVPLAHVLPIEQTTLNFVLESCLLIFCTTICACIIFVPKIKARNKVQGRMLQPDTTKSTCSGTSGSRVNSVKTGNTQVSGQSSRNTYEVSSKTSTEDLTMEIKELKNQITMDAIAMAKLKKSILAATGNLHFYKSANEYVVFQSDSSVKGDDIDPVSDLQLQSVC